MSARTEEELNIDIPVGKLIGTIECDYPKFHLSMDCFWGTIESGEIQLNKAAEARWLSYETIDDVDWLPADKGLVDKIKERLRS